MSSRIFIRNLALLALLALPAVCPAQDSTGKAETPIIEQLAAKLPPDVAAAARKWLHVEGKQSKALLAFDPTSLEQQVMVALASEPDAADFVLGRLPVESPATCTLVLRVITVDDFWVDHPGVVTALRSLGESSSTPELMLSSLDAARRIEVKQLRAMIALRIASARKAGDAKALDTLAAADERWLMLERGATLPGFMRRVPAVFAARPAGQPIHIVAIGDFGTGSDAQRQVAASIVRMGSAQHFDFGITVGDNFYQSGMTSTDDPRWKDWWEALYSPLGIPFYPTLGNHEYYSDDGAVSELMYQSPSWRFPAPYYSYTAGPVQFFAVDTTGVSEEQALWLDKAIGASTARWKVVYGHHPIFAPNRDAKDLRIMAYTKARLWPILRGRVDAYVCGHQHALARMDAIDGVHFFMAGGGGAPLGKVAKKTPGAAFAESAFGFLTLEADEAHMKVTIFDAAAKPLDEETIAK